MVFLGFNGSERGILEVVGRGLVGKGDLIDVFCVPTQTRRNGVVIDQVITYLKEMGASCGRAPNVFGLARVGDY